MGTVIRFDTMHSNEILPGRLQATPMADWKLSLLACAERESENQTNSNIFKASCTAEKMNCPLTALQAWEQKQMGRKGYQAKQYGG